MDVRALLSAGLHFGAVCTQQREQEHTKTVVKQLLTSLIIIMTSESTLSFCMRCLVTIKGENVAFVNTDIRYNN